MKTISILPLTARGPKKKNLLDIKTEMEGLERMCGTVVKSSSLERTTSIGGSIDWALVKLQNQVSGVNEVRIKHVPPWARPPC